MSEVRLAWDAPTHRDDGSPLTNLAGFRVKWGQGAYDNSVEINDPAVTEYAVFGLGAGTWNFTATAIDADGFESVNSNKISNTIAGEVDPPPDPGPETSVVYALVQSADRLALVPVGTVPAGTVKTTQEIRDYNGVHGYVVARDAVTWAGSVRPRVVVCV